MKKFAIFLTAILVGSLLVTGAVAADGVVLPEELTYGAIAIALAGGAAYALAGFFKNAGPAKDIDWIKICITALAGAVFGLVLIFGGKEITEEDIVLMFAAYAGLVYFAESAVKGIARRYFGYLG